MEKDLMNKQEFYNIYTEVMLKYESSHDVVFDKMADNTYNIMIER